MRKLGTFAIALTIGLLVPLIALAGQAVRREAARPVRTVDGGELYQAYCAVCHGKDGKGAGPAAPALKAPVPDLTTLSRRHGGKFPATDVEASITGQGRPMVLSHGTEEMPIWGPIFRSLSGDEGLARLRVANLVKYLESLQQP